MSKTAEQYFKEFDIFRQLRFQFIQTVEASGRSAEELKIEYDEFAAAQSGMAADHSKIKTNSLPLRIGIVGVFNAGKSSLINSLLGTELLGVHLKPATCRITVLSYKDVATPQIYQVFHNGHIEEISYEAYLNYSLHADNPWDTQNAATDIDHFEIHHPSPVLKDFQLVDTPGFSSLSEEDDQMTKAYLDKVDLLLWLFSANGGAINDEEKQLLADLANKKVVGVINRIDELVPSVREEVIESFSGDFDFYKITPYSATIALAYQKAVELNRGIYEAYSGKIEELLLAGRDLRVVKHHGALQIFDDGQCVYDVVLVETDADEEEIKYHDALLNILHGLREELTDIKSTQLMEQITGFYQAEANYWQELLAELQEIQSSNTTEFEQFENELVNLLEQVKARGKTYYEDFEEGLAQKIFDILYTFDYKSGFWENTCHVRKKKISDYKASLRPVLDDAFDTFHEAVIKDLEEGLEALEITLGDEVVDLEIIEELKERFVLTSYESVYGAYHMSVDYELGVSVSEAREIITQRITLLIADLHFMIITLMLIHKICTDIVEKAKTDYNKDQVLLAKFINTIKETIHE